jgi:hypothetical protein
MMVAPIDRMFLTSAGASAAGSGRRTFQSAQVPRNVYPIYWQAVEHASELGGAQANHHYVVQYLHLRRQRRSVVSLWRNWRIAAQMRVLRVPNGIARHFAMS